MPAGAGKAKVRPLQLPPVRGGPLAQRAERAKSSLRGTRGLYGVGKGMGLYVAEFQRQKNGLIEEIAATQKSLDQVDSTLIGVDSQIQALVEAIGATSPQDVFSAVDGARAARRDFGDNVQTLRDTIDRLNAAAKMVQEAEDAGQSGPFSPAQQALEKSYKESRTLRDQVATVKRGGGALASRVESATQVVNRYVDRINAEAGAYLAEQQKAREAEEIARRLGEEQVERERKAEEQRLKLEREASERQAKRERDAEEAQRKFDEQRAEVERRMEAAREAQQRRMDEQQRLAEQAAQQAPIQYAPAPPQPSTYVPPGPTKVDVYLPPEDYFQAQPIYAPQAPAAAAPVQYLPDFAAAGPSSEGFGAATGWGGQVWGYAPHGGVGQTPVSRPVATASVPAGSSASVVVQQSARDILRRANVDLATARKELERQRILDEERKATEERKRREAEEAARAPAPQPTVGGGFWTTGRKVAAALLGGLAAGGVAYAASGTGRRK